MVFRSFQSLRKNWGLFGAFAIVSLILWNTNILFQVVKNEERTKMELWATAQKELIESNDLSRDYGTLTFDVLQKIGVTPMIQVNEQGKIIDFRNIDWKPQEDPDSLGLYATLAKLKKENAPIPIVYKDIINQTLYYGDSLLLVKLQYYPLALLLIIFLFGGLLYFFFQTNKASEQNRLWAGMAKETAHQIGTPLSSLMGWIDLLKEQNIAPASIEEMQKDIERLEVITERFSKVGSLPELQLADVVHIAQETIAYLKQRTGKQIQWEVELPEKEILLPLNASLLSWTLENLVKNGLDSMKGIGRLQLRLLELEREVRLLVIDEGSGIAPNNIKKIFQPGFTTKARGWGLGLSLAHRIIHEYHKGSIAVKESKLGKGTTFEIVLQKKDRGN
ncbi:HAMP domain-containing histidine kinase [Flavobacteriaceae bacterium]|nr:HAMP domain-containing histidine kinase [Flavobacteriaceae bacterium]